MNVWPVLKKVLPMGWIPAEYRKEEMTVKHQTRVEVVTEETRKMKEIQLTEAESNGLLQLANEKVLVREAVKMARRGEFNQLDHPLSTLTISEIRYAYKHGWYVMREVPTSSVRVSMYDNGSNARLHLRDEEKEDTKE